MLDEKASASQVLGAYAEHTGPLFAPHIQDTLSMLLKMGNYFHCQVREQAYIALPLLFTATAKAFPAQPSGKPCCPACPGRLAPLQTAVRQPACAVSPLAGSLVRLVTACRHVKAS